MFILEKLECEYEVNFEMLQTQINLQRCQFASLNSISIKLYY